MQLQKLIKMLDKNVNSAISLGRTLENQAPNSSGLSPRRFQTRRQGQTQTPALQTHCSHQSPGRFNRFGTLHSILPPRIGRPPALGQVSRSKIILEKFFLSKIFLLIFFLSKIFALNFFSFQKFSL